EPYGVKAVRLGEVGEIDATARIDPAGQTQAQFRQLGHTQPLGARGSSNGSYAARALARTRFGKMRVHDAPATGFLAEYHSPSADELLAPVVDVFGRRRGAGPIAFGAAMAPNHRHVVGHDAAEVERRPVARLHVLSVEFPQPEPMIAPLVGVPIEIEE